MIFLFVEQIFKWFGTFEIAIIFFFAHWAAIAIRGGDLEGIEEQFAEGLIENRWAADAHCAEGVAVIAHVEGDEFFLLFLAGVEPVLEGHFQGGFDGGGAIVGKEDPGEILRCDGD